MTKTNDIIHMRACDWCNKRFTITERTPWLRHLWMPNGSGDVYFCSNHCCDEYLYIPPIRVAIEND